MTRGVGSNLVKTVFVSRERHPDDIRKVLDFGPAHFHKLFDKFKRDKNEHI